MSEKEEAEIIEEEFEKPLEDTWEGSRLEHERIVKIVEELDDKLKPVIGRLRYYLDYAMEKHENLELAKYITKLLNTALLLSEVANFTKVFVSTLKPPVKEE